MGRFNGWNEAAVIKLTSNSSEQSPGKTLCVCKECNKEFLIWNSYIERDGKRLFCSNECRAKNMNGAGNHRYKPEEGWTICKGCGIKYKVKPTSLRNNKSKTYCSPECRNLHIGKIKKICPECWSEYEVYGSQLIRNKFCSKRCSSISSYRKNNQLNKGTQRGNGGKRDDLDSKYFRSSWEANYARYLNFLIENGEITKWEYEVDTFEFIKIKRGTRFYTPDFKIFLKDGRVEYHEVKGYMDQKSKVRHNRMRKFYPEIIIRLIDKVWFRHNGKYLSKIIKGWELNNQKGLRLY